MNSADINSINNALANIQFQINNITGDPLISYNQINRISSQQGNLYNSLYYGIGNLNAENIIVNNNTTITGNLIYSSLNNNGIVSIINGNISSTIGNIILNNGNIILNNGNIILNNGNLILSNRNINLNNGNLRLTYGNIILSNGDVNIYGNVFSEGISTISGQSAFKVQYGTTPTVNFSILITFDTPFVNVPTVIVSGFINSASPPIVYIRSISNTQISVCAKDNVGSNYGNLQFTWVAFGI